MSKAVLYKELAHQFDFTPVAAAAAGDVVQLPSGRAGIVATDLAAAEKGAVYVEGFFKMTKATSVVLLEGQRVFYSKTNGNVSYTGDFAVGTVVTDAASSATTVIVALNVFQRPVISLRDSTWSEVESTAAAAPLIGGGVDLAVTTAGSAQHAWAVSDESVDIAAGPIVEVLATIVNKGDNAVLDIDFGLVNAAGTTDFEAVTDLISFHVDGNSANIYVQSDDGTTDTAAVDTTVDLTEGTYAFFQIDLRNKTAPVFYINGVAVTATGTTLAALASGTMLKAAICIEKSGTDDTPGEIKVKEFNVRTKPSA